MTEAQILDVVYKVGTWLFSLAVVLVGVRYAVDGLKKDYKRVGDQMQVIGGKVDEIQKTLGTIKENAARHDQRAQDIQIQVRSIDARLLYLERGGDTA